MDPFHILLVDDDRSFRSYAKRALDAEGYHCDIANGVDLAHELMEVQDFDLLVVDINLAGDSGLDLVTRLPDGYAHVPVIIVTGDPTVATAVEALHLGVVDYVTKPALGLVDDVERALAKRQKVAALRARLARTVRALAQELEVCSAGVPASADLLLVAEDVSRSFPPEALGLLSLREKEILGHLVQGLRAKEIALRLFISVHTVRNHIRSILNKCGVHSQIELLGKLQAMKAGQ